MHANAVTAGASTMDDSSTRSMGGQGAPECTTVGHTDPMKQRRRFTDVMLRRRRRATVCNHLRVHSLRVHPLGCPGWAMQLQHGSTLAILGKWRIYQLSESHRETWENAGEAREEGKSRPGFFSKNELVRSSPPGFRQGTPLTRLRPPQDTP